MLAIVSLAVVVLVDATAGLPTPQFSSLQEALHTLSESDKQLFVRIQLAEALASRSYPRTSEDSLPDLLRDVPQDVRTKLQELSSRLPEDLPTRLYDDVTTRHDLSKEAVGYLVRNGYYCNRNGHCINPDDITNDCCIVSKVAVIGSEGKHNSA